MELLSMAEALKRKEELARAILDGKLFIYPTDTVYGIGCNAEMKAAVQRVREAKQQLDRPMSVIAPSKAWIRGNLEVGELAKAELKKLPGAYTFVLRKTNQNCVAENVSLGNTLGVRIPAHKFSELTTKAGVPFVTTSANLSGSPAPAAIAEIDKPLLEKADYVVDGGKLRGKASAVVDLTAGEQRVIRA